MFKPRKAGDQEPPAISAGINSFDVDDADVHLDSEVTDSPIDEVGHFTFSFHFLLVFYLME